MVFIRPRWTHIPSLSPDMHGLAFNVARLNCFYAAQATYFTPVAECLITYELAQSTIQVPMQTTV